MHDSSELNDNGIFEGLAASFQGEEFLSELPPSGGLLDSEALDFTPQSLERVDQYLQGIYDGRASAPDSYSDEDLFKIVLRAGSYVGETLRKAAPDRLDWVQYDRLAEQIDQMTNGLGKHPAVLGVLAGSTGLTLPLGKVYKFIQDGPGDSTHFFVNALLARWNNATS